MQILITSLYSLLSSEKKANVMYHLPTLFSLFKIWSTVICYYSHSVIKTSE